MSSTHEVTHSITAAVAVVSLGLGAFAGGWMIGRSSGHGEDLDARIGALEQVVRTNATAPQRPEPAAAPAPPSEASPAQVLASLDLRGAPIRGPEGAPVTIVAFSDFQCPYCSSVGPTLEQIRAAYPDRVRIVFKNFPLPMHAQAPAAHRAAMAAGAQGRFWEMHDRLFASQDKLDPASLREHAKALGLDLARYDADLASSELDQRLRSDQQQGTRIGVRGTPTFFVNGRMISGSQPFESFKTLIDQALQAPARVADARSDR
jgi:protein-disulfide isomerase